MQIENVGFTRINAAHSYGGMPLTIQTVQSLLGLPVDHYIEIRISGLVKVVDALGGVDLDVEKRMVYRDRKQDLDINLSPGFQHLNGTQAMGYVRFRHDAIGDFGRVVRQRKFMGAVMSKLFSPQYAAQIPGLMRAFLENVNTDLTWNDLLSLKRIMEQGSPNAFRTATLPATPVRVGRASMLQLDMDKVRETVNDVLLHQGIRVEVLNATTMEGLAATVADGLKQQGCEIVNTGNAAGKSETTLVVDHGSSAARAERVAQWLGKGAVSVAPGAQSQADVTVIVGRDIIARTLNPAVGP